MDYLRGKLRGKTPSWGRGSSPSPSPAPNPLQKCPRNDSLNYRALFEKEKHEKEMFGARLVELENQQKVLQNNLKRFLDLKKEMRSFQREAEESDRVVDELIKSVVPDFATHNYKRPNDYAAHGQEKRSRFLRKRAEEEKENDESWNHAREKVRSSPWRSRNNSFSSRGQDDSIYHALPVQADPEIPVTPDPDDPALPNLSYEWDEASTSQAANPIGRYNYSARCPSRLDELKLNLQFDVNSKKLPTKLQLEIKDKKGRVVFRKRQNLYYVKVQERLATLDAQDDYIMTITSITGSKQATEEVKIHNKFHQPTSDFEFTEPLSEMSQMTESMSVPLVTEEDTPTLLETCRSPSDASITSGFDEKSIDSIFDLPLSPRPTQCQGDLAKEFQRLGAEDLFHLNIGDHQEKEGKKGGQLGNSPHIMSKSTSSVEGKRWGGKNVEKGLIEDDSRSIMSPSSSALERSRKNGLLEEDSRTGEERRTSKREKNLMKENGRTVGSQSTSSVDESLYPETTSIQSQSYQQDSEKTESCLSGEEWWGCVGAGNVGINGNGNGESVPWEDKLHLGRDGRRTAWSMESAYDEVVREISEVPSCVSPDVPDLEEVVEISVVSSKDLEKLSPTRSQSRSSGSPRKNPFIMMKQPVVPEVLYRWQMGFRKGPCGYRKVPILKVQFKYDSTNHLLPRELDVSVGDETKRVRVGLGVCQAELAPAEGAEHLVGVVSRDRSGLPDPSIPKFEIPVRGMEEAELNQWYSEQPILTLPAQEQ